MIKYIFILIATFSITLNSFSQTTFWTENFETDSKNWNWEFEQDGKYVNYILRWKTSYAISGDYALTVGGSDDYGSTWFLGYNNITTHIYASINIDARGYEDLQLKFNWLGEGEASYDYGQVCFSADSGTNLYVFTDGGTSGGKYYSQSTSKSQTLNLPSMLENKIFTLYFSWKNDASGGKAPAFMVDDIVLKGTLIQKAPVAHFSPTYMAIDEGQSVAFTDKSTNNPTKWEWKFEGGTPSTSNDQNPTITYNTAGDYKVELKVSNSDGSDTKVENQCVYVRAVPKITTVSPNQLALGQTLNVTIGASKTYFTMSIPTIYFTNGTDFIHTSNTDVITNDLLRVDVTVPSHVKTGYYQVVVENHSEGKMKLDNALRVYDPSGIEDFSHPDFKIFPNPTLGKVNIMAKFDNPESFVLNIYNSQAKCIDKIEYFKVSSINETIDISHLEPSIYFIQYSINNQSYISKIVKK